MRHPFDGINSTDSNVPAPDPAASDPSRRDVLAQMAMAAAAAMVEVNRAAAQPQPPGAVMPGPNGMMSHGRWRHQSTAPGSPRTFSEEGILRPRPAAQSVDLGDEQLDKAWKSLGDSDAAKARIAFNQIYSAKKAVPFLKDRLKTIAGNPDAKKIAQLVKDLDAAGFAVRTKATNDLIEIGPAVIPDLQAALAAKPTLDVVRRLEMLLLKVKATPVFLQGQRGLQILAELPMKEAKDTIADIRKQAPETWLTKAANEPQAPQPPKPVPPVPAAPRIDANSR
jgi:hypothetical protein